MRKIFQWAMAAALICGASVFTACSSSEDNPAQEQAKKNRTEFIKHTRQNLKTLAENLNFSTWNSVNYFNTYINRDLLLNDEFDKTISRTFGQEIQKTMEVLPADVAERTGKKYGATVNLANFDYIFTSTATGFDVTPNTEDGLIVDVTNPYNPEYSARISIVGSGEEYDLKAERMSNDSVGVVVKIPARYDFTFSTKQNGAWVAAMTVCTELTVAIDPNKPEYLPAEAADIKKDAWNLKGTIKTSIPGDATEAVFNIGQDPRTHKSGLTLDYTHNGRKMIGLTAELTNTNGLTDLSQLTTSNSIMDVMQAIMLGNSIDNLQITLLDDLTTTIKVTDCQKVLVLQSEMASARRNYADQKTIEGYVSQLNQYISGSMTCIGLNNMQIPMKLQTHKIGVDWWAAPALNFADENGYVPLTEMLDKESLEYGINIIDHAAEPMQQSIVIVRQLMAALQKLQNAFFTSMNGK
jgi:PBP1b-binding outer membrane lipoprotein LpoB